MPVGSRERGINVALIARRPDPLEQLADELRAATDVQIRTASVDLAAPSVMEDLAPLVDGIEIGLLVYNAGAVYWADRFVDRELADLVHLVDLNCRGTVLLAHHFGAAMAARGRGGIILMTSMSAAAGSAYTAVYNASKAFDIVLAESLWIELGQRGVDVLGAVAGLTDTPAMRRSGVRFDDPTFVAMAADDVADEALGSTRSRPRARGRRAEPGDGRVAVARLALRDGGRHERRGRVALRAPGPPGTSGAIGGR